MSDSSSNEAKRSRPGYAATDEIEEITLDDELSHEAKEVFIGDLSSICEIDRNVAEELLNSHNWNMQAAIDNVLNKSDEGDEEVMIMDEDENRRSGCPTPTPTLASLEDQVPVVIRLPQLPDMVFDSSSDDEELGDLKSPELEKEMFMEKESPSGSSSASASSSPGHSARSFSKWAPETLSIISWNLDGLDEKNLEKRTEAVLGQIIMENHAIIFFQELIPQTCEFLATKLFSKYVPIFGTEDSSAQYFTATFLRRNHVIYEQHDLINFPGSTMGRNMLVTKAFIGRAKLCLINTHLESTAEFAEERKDQLQMCFNLCESICTPDYNVIFGGDLNLRDKEVTGIPPNVVDLWIQCGSRETCKYTWDLTRNTNKQMPSKYQPRLRFDRLYFKNSVPETLTPEFFGVTGIEKVAGTQSFPSDHWAVIAFFKLAKEARKPLPKKRKADSPSQEFAEND